MLARLLSGDDDDDDSNDDEDTCNASNLKHAADKCEFVHSNCGGIVGLVDYLAAYYCTDAGFARGVVGLLIFGWLVLLISLLATTADYYFVPALDYFSFDVLHLSPEVTSPRHTSHV